MNISEHIAFFEQEMKRRNYGKRILFGQMDILSVQQAMLLPILLGNTLTNKVKIVAYIPYPKGIWVLRSEYKFGNFWLDGKIIEKKYRERQVYIDYRGQRVGIVTLRKIAKKVELDLLPF